MRKAQFGESLLAGFVIALMAMLLDRISYGFAMRDRRQLNTDAGSKFLPYAGAVAIGLWALSFAIPALAV